MYGEAVRYAVGRGGRRISQGGDELSQAAPNLAESEGNLIVLSGVPLLADPRGALYWREHQLLAVADLHLEKGSSFAARGQMLPPTIPRVRLRACRT